MAGKNQRIGKLPNGTKIELFPCEQVEQFGHELKEILEVIGYPEAFITDGSCASDFFLRHEDRTCKKLMKKIGHHFGIGTPVTDELLVNIAKRIRRSRKGK
jgi:hypothetical protein